ncbi:MAG: hypothetical protein JXA25_07790 [Anaerolineales bacterium]|nr:hypothetical protein [Anaerolineales bacterium]
MERRQWAASGLIGILLLCSGCITRLEPDGVIPAPIGMGSSITRESSESGGKPAESTGTPVNTFALLDSVGLMLELPAGWTLEERNRRPLPTESVNENYPEYCADYLLLDSTSGITIDIRPDCGYADAGPVDCPDDAELIYEAAGCGGVMRYFDRPAGVFRYTTTGIAISGTAGEKPVCYFPAVIGLPVGDAVISAHIEVMVENSVDAQDVLEQIDTLILLIRSGK